MSSSRLAFVAAAHDELERLTAIVEGTLGAEALGQAVAGDTSRTMNGLLDLRALAGRQEAAWGQLIESKADAADPADLMIVMDYRACWAHVEVAVNKIFSEAFRGDPNEAWTARQRAAFPEFRAAIRNLRSTRAYIELILTGGTVAGLQLVDAPEHEPEGAADLGAQPTNAA